MTGQTKLSWRRREKRLLMKFLMLIIYLKQLKREKTESMNAVKIIRKKLRFKGIGNKRNARRNSLCFQTELT